MEKLDDRKSVNIIEDIWWVGFADYEAGFSNNPYLIVEKEEAVLFDPGPGHPFFRDLIVQKIQEVTSLEMIKYIVVHHQDPDLCGLIPYIEHLLHPEVVIICHPRTALFIPYYGTRKRIFSVGDEDILQLKSGREIQFIHAPYLHFAGNMMSYDIKTKSLFSGDIFGGFNRDWTLFADKSHIEIATQFIEHYIADKKPAEYLYNKLKKIPLSLILPQHGSIINKDINDFIEILMNFDAGQLINELESPPDDKQKNELLTAGKEWLTFWLKDDIKAGSLNELFAFAKEQGAATVALLFDRITRRAKELGVRNPLKTKQIHKWNNIQAPRSSRLLETTRQKLLTSQFSMLYGGETQVDVLIQRRLQAIKTKLIIMFIDIRGFTHWSENKPPDEIVRMLNIEMELITRTIYRHNGRVNKMIGDGVLAYFPESIKPYSLLAAINIHNKVKKANLLPVGIGMAFGEVILGDIGEELRLDFTLIGSTVNIASRLCDSAAKNGVVISAPCFATLPEEYQHKLQSYSSFEKIKIKIKENDPEVDGIRFLC
ncbi:MAG: hypothetical protein JXJ04_23720 [Spirochaetales bacterium]|nr:hypothetical protein [Spirochaetales bacterium]